MVKDETQIRDDLYFEAKNKFMGFFHNPNFIPELIYVDNVWYLVASNAKNTIFLYEIRVNDGTQTIDSIRTQIYENRDSGIYQTFALETKYSSDSNLHFSAGKQEDINFEGTRDTHSDLSLDIIGINFPGRIDMVITATEILTQMQLTTEITPS